MYQHISYDREFVDYFYYLKGKYPKELFNLEGIGHQLDVAKSSRDFFMSNVVSDTSVDENSNVDEHSVNAYESELHKPTDRLNAIYLIWRYLRRIYNTQVANEFMEAQITGDVYVNDMHGINKAYCFNFSTYDVACMGLPHVTKAKSSPPKHLSSFIGQLVHFTDYASESILGAVGLADILVVASWYVRKMLTEDPEVPDAYKWKQIKQEIQSLIFTCNQPFRGGTQSGFYNVSLYDESFLKKMCDEYIFMDGTKTDIELVKKLQIIYMDIMNETLRVSPITFPVTTACFAVDEENNVLDEEFLKLIAEKNLEFGYINIYAGKTSTLSSCCRLRSETDNEYFNSFGAGSTKIGSLGVVTINLPRIAVIAKGDKVEFIKMLKELTGMSIRINNIKRHILQKRIDGGHSPLYTHGFMALNKQYSTTGIVGLNEAIHFMDMDILEEDGQEFTTEILDTINKLNEQATKQYNAPHNCEQVPGENSAVKIAGKDRLLGYQDEFELYSNQFIPLVVNADMLDRIKLQGMFDSKMSGGAIAHLYIETKIDDPKLIADLFRSTIKQGVVYHAINYNLQECINGHFSIGVDGKCGICNGEVIANYTRVVGFLTNVKNWNPVRRKLDYPNRVWYEQ